MSERDGLRAESRLRPACSSTRSTQANSFAARSNSDVSAKRAASAEESAGPILVFSAREHPQSTALETGAPSPMPKICGDFNLSICSKAACAATWLNPGAVGSGRIDFTRGREIRAERIMSSTARTPCFVRTSAAKIGMPSVFESAAASTTSPSCSTTSAIVTTPTIGRPVCATWPSKYKLRVIAEASSIMTTRSID